MAPPEDEELRERLELKTFFGWFDPTKPRYQDAMVIILDAVEDDPDTVQQVSLEKETLDRLRPQFGIHVRDDYVVCFRRKVGIKNGRLQPLAIIPSTMNFIPHLRAVHDESIYPNVWRMEYREWPPR